MSKFAIGLRNVRGAHEVTMLGTNDAPRDLTQFTHVMDSVGVPNATAIATQILVMFPTMHLTDAIDFGTACAAAHQDASKRGDATTGAGSINFGKYVFQFGVGFHATLDATALSSMNWKDLS